MNNYRMFRLRYLPRTYTKPDRLRIIDTRFNVSVIISRGDSDYFSDDAIKYLSRIGIECVGRAWNEDAEEDYLFTDNFITPLNGGKN